jgi:hypothetical protein
MRAPYFGLARPGPARPGLARLDLAVRSAVIRRYGGIQCDSTAFILR